MDVALECVPCTLRSCLRLLDEGDVAEGLREDLLRRTLRFLAAADWRRSPPDLVRDLHAELRRSGWSDDPYREIKHRSNLEMLARARLLREVIADADDPFGTAVRLAVAGNVIDFGSRHRLDTESTIDTALAGEPAIDDTASLRADLDRARTVLYIGDNAGEIVLDGLLLETMAHPGVTFVVRGAPVINDATVDDARQAGIARLARVVTTGDDTPGVVPGRVSTEVREALAHADLIIAKGQGNLEGLWDLPRDAYFLFMAKCERIARQAGVEVGDLVIWKRRAATG